MIFSTYAFPMKLSENPLKELTAIKRLTKLKPMILLKFQFEEAWFRL